MNGTSRSPAGGRERHVDREALPDPALFTRRSAHRAAVRRIVFAAVALVAVAALGAIGLRGASARAGSARRAAAAATAALEHAASGGAALTGREEARPASPAELADLQKSWVGSEAIAPRSARVDPASGEEVLPFQGFGLQVDTAPSGASVLVDGEDMGTTPLLTTVPCQPGEQVRVLAKLGELSASAVTRCRKDVLVKLPLTLRRGR
ncbi:PEGA domain-containing protein [Anaeromyxobacter diazotrophicus]|uniref:PEGA domain-containing protein n=1 Tax=Anaeromyxobacter diazotrophicus TaxID=2590199 RepID=A0A7I9VIA0_9BACT|nr:PEGA domain-containing protein [Anaeromyxobacter diazotrophicus]GEJ56141.1 hypothetical protein AMYX_08820 [Anaeromyxobacter diazotrophicus]